MKIALLAILAIATLIGASTLVATQNGAYCLQGGEWGYPGSCQFSTYAECITTASRTNAACGRNPRLQ
jgi:hypothetical protein